MRKKNPELYQAIKTYVERHYEKDGRSPTVREIEAGTGINLELMEIIRMMTDILAGMEKTKGEEQ